MPDFPIEEYVSKYFCKLCKKQMFEISLIPDRHNCKCSNYMFDFNIMKKSNRILDKREDYYINADNIIINYLTKKIYINDHIYNFIDFSKYKLDDVEETFSLNSVLHIKFLYDKYKNII